MTLSPEKNDVDISSLFFYKKPVTITGNKDKELTVYMRLVGDAELQRARVKALRDSRKLRDALKDKNSDEYLAFIPDISEVEKDRLVELSLVMSLKEISADIAQEIELPFPEEPGSKATLEEQEAYQKEIIPAFQNRPWGIIYTIPRHFSKTTDSKGNAMITEVTVLIIDGNTKSTFWKVTNMPF